MYEVAVILDALKYRKGQRSKRGSRGSPPGKIKNLRKGFYKVFL
jgi:hypothetical protein